MSLLLLSMLLFAGIKVGTTGYGVRSETYSQNIDFRLVLSGWGSSIKKASTKSKADDSE